MLPWRPTLLLLDWDSTLTATSTLPLLASLSTFPLPHPSLAALTAAYNTALNTHNTAYTPLPHRRTSIPQELAYLDSLSCVERQSVERVEREGVFKGVTGEVVRRGARECVGEGWVRLRRGWEGAVGEVLRREFGRVGVISVAWSRGFIQSTLEAACEGSELCERVGDVRVMANEILGDGSGMLDRYFEEEGEGSRRRRGLWTAGDKLRGMRELVGERFSRECRERDGDGGSEEVKPWTVYVGDSPTDLACLLEADVGVCVRDDGEGSGEQKALRETLERVGVECKHVRGFVGKRERGGSRLWWAGDFEEVRVSGVLG